jgi:hypothetical protein
LFEGLGSISSSNILQDRSAAPLHHPLRVPHKLEYLPLIAGAGVAGFPARYCYGEYFLSAGDCAAELARYFNGLTSYANDRGLSAVFGLARSNLRLSWFKAQFPGCHIAVRRNPRHRWISYLQQAARGNTYFLERGAIILGRNLDHPALAGLRRMVDFPDIGRGLETESGYQIHALSLSVPQNYLIYAYLQKLAQFEALRNADIVLDLDALTRDKRAGVAAGKQIFRQTGIVIDFRDCGVPSYDTLVSSWAPLYDPLDELVDKALIATGYAPPDDRSDPGSLALTRTA